MLDFPRPLHQLHIFEKAGRLYAADLDKASLIEVSAVIVDILKLSETRTTDAITTTLKTAYSDEDIEGAFETLTEYAKQGLLFNRGENLKQTFAMENERRKLLVAIPSVTVDSLFDIEMLYAGANIALSYMIAHLPKYADLHFAGNQNRKLADRVYEVDISLDDLGRLSQQISDTYFGILTLHRDHEKWLLPLYRNTELPPILAQIHAPRGHGGKAINSILRHYAAMRDFDAFTAPSDYVAQFYSDYVWDTSFFNTLPNGVDSALFRPMDKEEAKRELAGVIGDQRILTTPTVGYLSRVQSEKGASVYLKLAKLNPHFLFLVAGPHLGRYTSRELPDNLIYAGFHPREKLPVIYNAFDVYCFPSMSGEETFGLTVLEAMACGVPPVVPNFDGVPSVVGDAGLVADAENFDQDIATLVSYPCPIDFSKKINLLLNDHAMREMLSSKARERAIAFTWDKTAERIMEFFQALHRKKLLASPNKLLSTFAPQSEASNTGKRLLKYKSIVLGMDTYYERSLIGEAFYSQPVEDGLVLDLLKNHTAREVEAVLTALIADQTEAKMILNRVRGLIHATA